MRFDIVTIFPRMVEAGIAEGVVGRGVERGLLDVKIHDLREFTTDRHRSVDDVPYGGGPGMVMKPEPLLRAVEHIGVTRGGPDAVVLLSPQGRPFTQAEAARLGRLTHVVLLCGRYEGMDERVHELVRDQPHCREHGLVMEALLCCLHVVEQSGRDLGPERELVEQVKTAPKCHQGAPSRCVERHGAVIVHARVRMDDHPHVFGSAAGSPQADVNVVQRPLDRGRIAVPADVHGVGELAAKFQ